MTDDHECDWPDTCPVCRGPAPRLRDATRDADKLGGPTWSARYDGWCSDCGGRIHEGQTITVGEDTSAGGADYVHVRCP